MTAMKTLLVNPPYFTSVYKGLKDAVTIEVPLGLAYLAAVLEKNNFKVDVLDANVLELSIDETGKRILASDADVIGFSATSNTITKVYKLAKIIKENSNKKIVVGGVHVTTSTQKTFEECPFIDVVTIGEAEETLLELIKNNFKDLKNIKGIAFVKDGKVTITEKRPPIEDLDSLPFPARHLFPLKLYRPGAFFNTGIKNSKTATISTSRGCPNRCTYCASVHFWGTRVRFRSAENVVKEIKELKEKDDLKQLAILDDTFTANPERVKKICELLIKENLRIRWWCYARVNTLNEELMLIMKKAGCYAFNFGVESSSEEILKGVNKNIKTSQVEKIIKTALKHGFLVHTSFMIGLPGDTKKTVMDTINFAIKLNNHVALFCITTPFPGTELYDLAKEKGWMTEIKSWDDMGLHMKTKYRNDALSSEEIYELYTLASRKFYYRPGFFWTLLKRWVKHPNEIKGFIMAALFMIMEQNS